MTNLPVLVLNQNYEPLHICRARRAVVLLFRGKAEMLEDGAGFMHSAGGAFPIPSVIRVVYLVKRHRNHQGRLTRPEVFRRDQFTCQYCGKKTQQLTLDHVTPRYRGGKHIWENVVSSCVVCNRRKAGSTPEQAGMKLLRRPAPPKDNHSFHIPVHYLETQHHWHKYLNHHPARN
ncbi:MAG: HNH endonuclease [Chloroflexota bacterium]